MNARFGVVLPVQEIDDGHVDLLAVTVAPPDALFDPLRVPGQVIVDKQGAELKVDAFGAGLGRDQDRAVVPKGIDDGRLHICGLRA